MQYGFRLRASTKPPTLLRSEGWGTLRGDLWFWQEDEIEQRCFIASSDHHGFLVFAEGAAEGVGNFAYGGVGFDGVEDGGH
jgi:hypothetical protein